MSPADRFAVWTILGGLLLITQTRAQQVASPKLSEILSQNQALAGSTESFWTNIATTGTPLVEPANDARQALVTFLWRHTPDTENVLVIGSFSILPSPDYLMERMPGTDIWFLTIRLPAGARFAYKLSVNDPLVFDGSETARRDKAKRADPLNPHRWGYKPGATAFEYASRVELPGAPVQPWIVKDSTGPAGDVRRLRYESEALGNERDIWIYTPPGYGRNREPAALLLVFDGQAYLDHVPTPTILDNLTRAARIPPTVAVLIGNPSQAIRNIELPPNEAFASFLAKELIPWIRSRYSVTDDPRLTVAAGSSFGCLAAANVGLRHPKVFGKILCQSGAFWWAPDHKFRGAENAITEPNWLATQFRDSPQLPLSFYLDAGVFEVDMTGSGGVILEPTRHFRDVLLAKGYRVTYQQFVGGHDYLSWRGTFAGGLIALLGDGE